MKNLKQLLMKKKISRIKRIHQNEKRSDAKKVNLIEEGKNRY